MIKHVGIVVRYVSRVVNNRQRVGCVFTIVINTDYAKQMLECLENVDELPAAIEAAVPIFRANATSDNKQPLLIILVLDSFQFLVMGTKECFLRVLLVKRSLGRIIHILKQHS
jgi:hypothetical protein